MIRGERGVPGTGPIVPRYPVYPSHPWLTQKRAVERISVYRVTIRSGVRWEGIDKT